MNFRDKISDVILVVLVLFCLKLYYSVDGRVDEVFQTIDKKYYLVSQAYQFTRNLFEKGKQNYNRVKYKALLTIDTFLDLVNIMNEEMAKELRTSIIKFYKVKYFHDFSNYAISMEEMIEITEHCLLEPVEKLEQTRNQFHGVIKNFEDVRNFNVVATCIDELPDEVAAAHCVLHQAVLLNETMQDNLVSIIEIKTRQHAQEMNNSIFSVKNCLNDFVPKFYEQLLAVSYTPNCEYLKIVNASITDILKDKWKSNNTSFLDKWSSTVKLLKDRKLMPEMLTNLMKSSTGMSEYNKSYLRQIKMLANETGQIQEKENMRRPTRKMYRVKKISAKNETLLVQNANKTILHKETNLAELNKLIENLKNKNLTRINNAKGKNIKIKITRRKS